MTNGVGVIAASPPVRRVRKRAAMVFVAFAALLVLGGCKVDITTRVAVAPDGTGTIIVDVFLDPEAAAKAGDIPRILVIDDLAKAGWKVAGPASPHEIDSNIGTGTSSAFPDGTVQLHLTHDFANVDEANTLLANLNGPDGPYRDVKLTRASGLFSTELGVRGSVDLSKGLDAFSDPALVETLGAPLSEIVARSGTELPEADDLTVTLGIEPRRGQSWSGNNGNAAITPELVGASTSLGGQPQSIDVTSSRTHWGVIVAMGAAGAFVVVILGLLVTAPRRRQKRYKGRHVRR